MRLMNWTFSLTVLAVCCVIVAPVLGWEAHLPAQLTDAVNQFMNQSKLSKDSDKILVAAAAIGAVIAFNLFIRQWFRVGMFVFGAMLVMIMIPEALDYLPPGARSYVSQAGDAAMSLLSSARKEAGL